MVLVISLILIILNWNIYFIVKIPTAILSTTAKALARAKRGEESKSAIKTERKAEEAMEVVRLILCEYL